MNPYLRVIMPATDADDHLGAVPKGAIVIDIYQIIDAYAVTCPARQHAIKKLLLAGERGVKSADQDLSEACDAVRAARRLERNRQVLAAKPMQ